MQQRFMVQRMSDGSFMLLDNEKNYSMIIPIEHVDEAVKALQSEAEKVKSQNQ